MTYDNTCNHSWTHLPSDGDDLRRLMAQIAERKRHFERLDQPALAATAEALLRKLRASGSIAGIRGDSAQ